jgi:hypothetical protein
MSPRTWSLVYQQQQVMDDGVFNPDAIAVSINGNRVPGVIPRGMHGNREGGMDGLMVVAGMDPAMVGFTGAVCIGLDPQTQKRYVLDVSNEKAMTPDQIRDLIRRWTDKYGISEWRIEKNAFQSMLTQDREVREFLAAKGCVLREHTTGQNKWASDFGVASLSMLWTGWEDKAAMIELPSARTEAVKALIEQLIVWQPDLAKTAKTDVVMALWFTELACRDLLQSMGHGRRTHAKNPFLTGWDIRQQQVIRADDQEVWSQWTSIR